MPVESDPTLEMQIEKAPQLITVRCTGRVVIETWPKLSTTLRELIPEHKLIRVNLEGVDRVDSVGIGAMVAVWASAKKAGCDLKFCKPHKYVQDVVELTRLYDLFEKQ